MGGATRARNAVGPAVLGAVGVPAVVANAVNKTGSCKAVWPGFSGWPSLTW